MSKSLVSKYWAGFSLGQRAIVLVLGLIFLFLLSAVVIQSIRVHTQQNTLSVLRTQQNDVLENLRTVHEIEVLFAYDSIETLNVVLISRDDSIEILNRDFTHLENQDHENDVFVASLDSTGLLNELKRIRAVYRID